MTKKTFYLTTTLPYVNAEPHIGFALEMVQADARARLERLLGKEVFFNTGADEHGLKIYEKAKEKNVSPQEYVDEYAAKFDNLKQGLNLSYDKFIRTTDPEHEKAAQEFWQRCNDNGYIYKAKYQIKYCVGCELAKTDSELENGKCKLHPDREIEIIDEENYFFKFSEFQKPLLDLYKNNPDFVIPSFRFNEVKRFIEDGPKDFSISRLKEKMPWGVPVPGDDEHVIYVWFDALINYISTIGWPDDKDSFEKWWPTVQFAGKDQIRQQAAMWQAMLLSINLPPSKQIFIHGFINFGGEKISKSLGNTVDPFVYVKEYGTDALRYYLLRHTHPFEDSDFTREKFVEAYNANLANGLGNLFSRIMKMYVSYGVNVSFPSHEEILSDDDLHELKGYIEGFEFNKALDYIWKGIGELDAYIQKTEPFKLIKTDEEKAKEIVAYLVIRLYEIAVLLEPFLPESSKIIKDTIKSKKIPESLFIRK